MYGMDTHTTVKTLLSKGFSRRKIAEQLGIHRKVVKRVERDDFGYLGVFVRIRRCAMPGAYAGTQRQGTATSTSPPSLPQTETLKIGALSSTIKSWLPPSLAKSFIMPTSSSSQEKVTGSKIS